MNPRLKAQAATRPGPFEGLIMMAVGAAVLGFAFITQVDGFSPKDIARAVLPGASEMAASVSASVGL